MDLTRAGGCPGSTTGSAGRRNQHIRDHWQEGSKSVGERRHPSPIRRASPGRSLGSQPSLFRLADNTSPPCDVSEKARPCGCGAVVARLLPKQETAGSNPAEGTRNRKLLRYLSSASCSSCVGSLTAESRSPKPWDAGSRPARRAKTVLLGSFLTHGFSQVKRYRPNGSGRLFEIFLISFRSRPVSMPRWRNW